MMPEPTPSTPLAHGGRLIAARRMFPDAPEPFIDLSTGINPVPYPLPPLPPEVFTRLPEPEAVAALQATAATAYGAVDPAMVAAAPGTQILIELLPRLWPARDVAVLGPTYGEHAAAWRRGGAVVREVATLDALAGAEVAVLCQPNNPDGRCWPPESLLRLTGPDRLLVVDEAFADLEGDGVSMVPALPRPGLVVLRSFGKSYGLAGLRLGFAVADVGFAAAVREALGPWAVSGPAIVIGAAALADTGWRIQTAARLAGEAAALDALLVQGGLVPRGGTRLFRLVQGHDADGTFAALGRAGLLVRRFEAHPTWLRFGLPGSVSAWQRLRDGLLSC
jgi:cobalamin biosynthetic protein CobC